MSHNVHIADAVKSYGNFNAVDNVTIDIKSGELFTLLGPSGCGKTTLLRMIAGFNSIENGTISFDKKIINTIPAHKRNIGMVFQNYAIFPHLSVFDNVAYGLKARKIKKTEIAERVLEALRMVQIENLKDRSPANMSGGQQQRVALARAIVIHPDILLMDEPLSNLDAKLRIQMRVTIKKVQKKLGITTIYVTHDQEEALAISDRIAVMKNGKIQQVGTPKEIYTKPANKFVASFIGTSNILTGMVVENKNGDARISITDGLLLTASIRRDYKGPVSVSVRPEAFQISPDKPGSLKGYIALKTFLGDFINYEISLSDGTTVEVNQYLKDMEKEFEVGDFIALKIPERKFNVFDVSKEELLLNE